MTYTQHGRLVSTRAAARSTCFNLTSTFGNTHTAARVNWLGWSGRHWHWQARELLIASFTYPSLNSHTVTAKVLVDRRTVTDSEMTTPCSLQVGDVFDFHSDSELPIVTVSKSPAEFPSPISSCTSESRAGSSPVAPFRINSAHSGQAHKGELEGGMHS